MAIRYKTSISCAVCWCYIVIASICCSYGPTRKEKELRSFLKTVTTELPLSLLVQKRRHSLKSSSSDSMANPEGFGDDTEELFLLIEELQDAVIFQDEELREKDAEISELEMKLEALTVSSQKAKDRLRLLELSHMENSDTILTIELEAKDAIIRTLVTENEVLKREKLQREAASAPQLQEPRRLLYTEEDGPETSVRIRKSASVDTPRSIKMANPSGDNVLKLSSQSSPFVPRTKSPLRALMRDKILKRLVKCPSEAPGSHFGNQRSRQAWAENPVRDETDDGTFARNTFRL